MKVNWRPPKCGYTVENTLKLPWTARVFSNEVLRRMTTNVNDNKTENFMSRTHIKKQKIQNFTTNP